MALGIICGLLSSFAIGLSLVLIKKSYEELSPSVAFAFQTFFGVLIWIPFALYIGVTYNLFALVLLLALVSAVLSEAFYYYIFSKGDVGLTTTVFATYPIFTIIFSFVLLSERPPAEIMPFVFIIILGIIVLSLPHKSIKNISHKHKAIIWGLIGAFAVGLADTLSKGIIDKTSASTFLLGLAVMQVPVAFLFLHQQKESFSQFTEIFTNGKKYAYSMLGAFLGVIGVLFLWLTFEVTYASIASPLTASFPLFTVILAYLWLKEEVSKRDIIGIAILLAGIIGVGFFI